MKQKFEFYIHKRVDIGLSIGSNRSGKNGAPQNLFISLDLLFLSIDYDLHFKLLSLPRWLNFLATIRKQRTDIINEKSKIYKGYQVEINLRKLIAKAVSFRVSIGKHWNGWGIEISILRWCLSCVVFKLNYSFLVALERLIGIPNLLVSKENSKYSCVKKDTLKLLGVKIPNEHCDDWDTDGNT